MSLSSQFIVHAYLINFSYAGGIGKAASGESFKDSSTSEDESLVVEPQDHVHTPRDARSIPEEVDSLLLPRYLIKLEQGEEENIRRTELEVDLAELELEGVKNQDKFLPSTESLQHFPGDVYANDHKLLDLTLFGKVTTTTVDPIAAILKDVVIVDHKNYLPKGYVIRPERIVEDEVELESKNINDLLRKPDIKYKPGKLFGKKLAAFSKELKEAELFYSNAVNIAKQEIKDDVVTTSTESPNKILSDEDLALSAEDIFASILEGKEIELDVLKAENEIRKDKLTTKRYGWRELEDDMPVTTAATTTTTTTTTSTPRPTTPSLCGAFCNLAGTLFIKSGLDWSEELLYSSTNEYKEAINQIVKELSSIFDHVYFGSSFEFASVEAYSRRDEMVLVDVYIQFSDIVFQVSTKDVKESFVERLVEENDRVMMGKYEIDATWTYFSVIDTSVPEASLTVTRDEMGIFLPEWSLLAIVVGVISFFTTGFIGVIACVNRQRNNQLLKKHVLNPRTLQIFKSKRHFDTVEVDNATAYANDKRDMWTLQKDQQKKKSKSSLAMRPSYTDSGHGSGSGLYSFIPEQIRNSFGKRDRKLIEKFPTKRIKSSYDRNHNDSGTELLDGFNNTGLDNTALHCSEDIIEKNTTTDTSYENERDDYERKVSSDRTRTNKGGKLVNIVQVQDGQGCFDDSDSSDDAVSHGHREELI